MLRGELPTDIEVEAFNKALVLHADHELNASAFTARCAVSSLSDMYWYCSSRWFFKRAFAWWSERTSNEHVIRSKVCRPG